MYFSCNELCNEHVVQGVFLSLTDKQRDKLHGYDKISTTLMCKLWLYFYDYETVFLKSYLIGVVTHNILGTL